MRTRTFIKHWMILVFIIEAAVSQEPTKTPLSRENAKIDCISLSLGSISLKNDRTGVDEPAVALTVTNSTDIEIPFPDTLLFAELEGKEALTTLLQRQITHRLKTGESEIQEGGYEPGISPGKTFTRTYRLSDYYQITAPGTYKVWMRAAEEVTLKDGKWVVAAKQHWASSNTVEIPIK